MSDTTSQYFTSFIGRKVYDKVLYDEMLEAISVLSRELAAERERADNAASCLRSASAPTAVVTLSGDAEYWKQRAETAESRLREIKQRPPSVQKMLGAEADAERFVVYEIDYMALQYRAKRLADRLREIESAKRKWK